MVARCSLAAAGIAVSRSNSSRPEQTLAFIKRSPLADQNSRSFAYIRGRINFIYIAFSLQDFSASSIGFNAQIFKQRSVFIRRGVRRGEQSLTGKDGICSGKKAQQDGFTRELLASGCQAHHRTGHQDAGARDGPHHDERIEIGLRCQRRAFRADQHIDGHAFRMRRERCQLMQ